MLYTRNPDETHKTPQAGTRASNSQGLHSRQSRALELCTGGARARIFSTTGQPAPLLVLQFTSWTFTFDIPNGQNDPEAKRQGARRQGPRGKGPGGMGQEVGAKRQGARR
ncbi:hypothetical protein EYF80_023233 [Liparis tanakae]|uniref:Uncharacterized protein n=1 Tax=Liparis tanakae TaxID=230148 RepID=A0A4Z2HLD1_9TELE|nr:hypothetical protein EYF80_023233 [Liparis tanakae]